MKVTTIQQALTFLGFQTTRNLITAAAVTGCFPDGDCAGFDDKDCVHERKQLAREERS